MRDQPGRRDRDWHAAGVPRPQQGSQGVRNRPETGRLPEAAKPQDAMTQRLRRLPQDHPSSPRANDGAGSPRPWRSTPSVPMWASAPLSREGHSDAGRDGRYDEWRGRARDASIERRSYETGGGGGGERQRQATAASARRDQRSKASQWGRAADQRRKAADQRAKPGQRGKAADQRGRAADQRGR